MFLFVDKGWRRREGWEGLLRIITSDSQESALSLRPGGGRSVLSRPCGVQVSMCKPAGLFAASPASQRSW